MAHTVSIPKPCHENWNEMTPVEKGRFCTSCQKQVRDFTTSSDREIAAFLEDHHHACGRFNASQLNRRLVVPKEKSSAWIVAASGILGMLSTSSLQAQQTGKPAASILAESPLNEVELGTPPDPPQTQESEIIGKMALSDEPGTFTLTGTVSDYSSPLPGAIVRIADTSTGVITDIDGKYAIDVTPGQIVVYSFVGMKDKQIETGVSRVCNVALTERAILDEVVVTGKVERANFFRRTYYRVRGWFRKKSPRS